MYKSNTLGLKQSYVESAQRFDFRFNFHLRFKHTYKIIKLLNFPQYLPQISGIVQS